MVDDKKKVKHNGFTQVVLTIILFIVGAYIFGDWTKSPLISSLSVGADLVRMFSGVETGNMAATEAAAVSTPQLLILSFINLLIYYVVAGVLIFLFNIVFKSRKEKMK